MRDVGMIQRRERLGFALESREPLGIRANASGRTLIATSRPRFVSRARYTSPMPPNLGGDLDRGRGECQASMAWMRIVDLLDLRSLIVPIIDYRSLIDHEGDLRQSAINKRQSSNHQSKITNHSPGRQGTSSLVQFVIEPVPVSRHRDSGRAASLRPALVSTIRRRLILRLVIHEQYGPGAA